METPQNNAPESYESTPMPHPVYTARKYTILIPVIFLLFNTFFFIYASREVNAVLLDEKYLEVVHATEMLAAAIEANPDRAWYEHERNIVESVEFLDNLYQVYAGAYKLTNDELELLTYRAFETSVFEPLDFSEFIKAINEHDSGKLVIGYTPENQTYRELHLYFRWMPLYSGAGERFLVVTGVSQYSVVNTVPLHILAGVFVSILLTFVINAWLVSKSIRLITHE